MIKADSLGEIHPEVLYRYDRLKEVAALGDHAMRQAKRAGLRTITLHGRQFVFGRDFLDYASQQTNGNGAAEHSVVRVKKAEQRIDEIFPER